MAVTSDQPVHKIDSLCNQWPILDNNSAVNNDRLYSSMEPMDHSTTVRLASGPQSINDVMCLPNTNHSDPLPVIVVPILPDY